MGDHPVLVCLCMKVLNQLERVDLGLSYINRRVRDGRPKSRTTITINKMHEWTAWFPSTATRITSVCNISHKSSTTDVGSACTMYGTLVCICQNVLVVSLPDFAVESNEPKLHAPSTGSTCQREASG